MTDFAFNVKRGPWPTNLRPSAIGPMADPRDKRNYMNAKGEKGIDYMHDKLRDPVDTHNVVSLIPQKFLPKR